MSSKPNLRSDLSQIDLFASSCKSRIEGLALLEQLCVSGAWVPAWIVRDHLKNMSPNSKAMSLILARTLQLRKASGILEEAGADVYRVDECGNTILHSLLSQAAISRNIAVVDIVVDGTKIKTTSIPSRGMNVEEAILSSAKYIISNEEGLVTAVNNSKELPLHVAAKFGLAQILNLLIEAGSDINAVTNSKDTPLNICAENGHLECLNILLDKGADMDIHDIGGAFPIHAAVDNGHFECVELLIENGADINLYTDSGHSPLHIGVAYGHVAIVEMLIQNNVEMDPVDVDGRTPLHMVVNCRNTDHPTTHMVMMNQLIRGGASLNIKDDEGNTPLHIAVRNQNAIFVKRLTQAGADVSLMDGTGCTPLQLAENISAETCVEILKNAKTL